MGIARIAWAAPNSESRYPNTGSANLEYTDVRSQSHHRAACVPGNRDAFVLAVSETNEDEIAFSIRLPDISCVDERGIIRTMFMGAKVL